MRDDSQILIGALEELQPTVNFASHALSPAGTVWGPRINPDYQFFYLLSGRAAIVIGGDARTIGPGECALYGPDCPHSITVLEEAVFIGIHFLFRRASPVPVHPAFSIQEASEEALAAGRRNSCRLALEGGEELELPPFMAIPGLEPILMRIVKEYMNEQPGYAMLLRSLMTELLLMTVRSRLADRPKSAEHSKIEPALQAIHREPEKNWTVAELAALCGYHAIYFSSLFRKCTGDNPKQYLISQRIRKAKYYLLSGEKMEAIAERLGYTSVHYFSRNFKEETGLTPTEFKQQ
ncbi:helix-turn-helix domain-containing protein [Paenibacillus sacheonensis]|uniref:Helix-turn-helix domain-containing protein n=1 Tax=Paenibacillus sacheonensis TaxID=742054 RepID=A0A7X4YS77_9BACL|nr:AraC family transcriptional regulator [Paenibacillus sacheonensis]MBM7566908.1 AraC-like DNA-binding protein [Paenibacillus sacheonensis]NBC71530.1 helix-turn-helix domain-containing protein [Paenibacillus sacheonensis]